MGNKFGWHSGVLTCKDAKLLGDLYVQDDIVFSDVSAGVLGITGGIDMQSTTSAIGIDLGGTFSTTAINIDGANATIGLKVATSAGTPIDLSSSSGDVSNIILGGYGRISTSTKAGAALTVDGTFTSTEALELRYQVSAFSGSDFTGMYLRSEAITNAATAKSVYGTQIYGVCNNVTMTTGSLWGTLTYAYCKGVDAVTINNMYAGQFENSWDASRTGDCTITTESAIILAKYTAGRVADYTKLHGIIVRLGEMDGDSQTFGKGIFIEDDAGMSGTSTLTTGIDLEIGCTTGIAVRGACTDGIIISGACSDNGIEISGACTGSAIEIVTGAFGIGLNVNADGTTGIAVANTFSGTTMLALAGTGTDGINISGICGDAIEISAAATTTGLNISADCVTGITIGAQTTAGITIGATATGISIGACSTVGITFTGINTKNITMGTTGSGGTTTALGTLGASWYGIEMSVSANCAGYEAHAIRAEIETTTGTAGNIMCGRFDAVATHSVNTLNGINATAQMNDDLTIGGRVAAGYISLYGEASKTITRTANSIYALFVQHLLYSDPGPAIGPFGSGGEAGDFYNAAIGVSMPSGTYCDYGIVLKGETNGTIAGILLGPHGTTTWENGIRFSNGSPGDSSAVVSGGITNAIYFDSQCPVVDLIKWEATGYGTGCVDVADTITTQSGASTGAIKVDVAGIKYYIPIFEAGSQGAGP